MVCKLGKTCGNTCDKFCVNVIGDNLARFLREVDCIESSIGNLADKPYIVSGIMVGHNGETVNVLSPISQSIEMKDKFISSVDESSMQILKSYIKLTSAEDGEELIDKLSKINSSKLLISPFKPGMPCEVLVEVHTKEGKKEVFKQTKIDSIKWFNTVDDGLQCTVITAVIDTNGNKRGKVKPEEYGERIKLVDIERNIVSANIDRSLIKMNKYGLIQPIQVMESAKSGIIIDNTYMYSVENKTVTMVAYWDKAGFTGEKAYMDIAKGSAYKRIKKNIQFIAAHRRYMAPYGLMAVTQVGL